MEASRGVAEPLASMHMAQWFDKLFSLTSSVAMVAAIVAAGPAAAALDTPGWRAYNGGRYAEAVTLWQQEAALGDNDAQFGLGIAYDLGRGVPKDSLVACDWYTRAGEAGHVSAAFNVAVLHDSARCGPRQAEQAATWYARAAAAGLPRAQFSLAQLYAAGDGVPPNPDQAAAWYRAAAAGGIAAASGRIQTTRPQPGSEQAALAPVVPTSPDGSRPLPGGEEAPIALVWAAPAQPRPVRFLVELFEMEPPGIREVLARYVDVSATQVRLPPVAARYAWRVFAIGIDTPRYAAGPWQQFAVAPAGRL